MNQRPKQKLSITQSIDTTATMTKSMSTFPEPMNMESRSHLVRTSSNDSSEASRKVWWTPKKNQVQIPNQPIKMTNVQSKVGSLANIEYQPGGGQVTIPHQPVKVNARSRIDSLSNAKWSTPPPRVSLRHEKLQWNAQSKVGSLDNIKHKPGGGVVQIYEEKLNFEHVTPRTDSGFVD